MVERICTVTAPHLIHEVNLMDSIIIHIFNYNSSIFPTAKASSFIYFLLWRATL